MTASGGTAISKILSELKVNDETVVIKLNDKFAHPSKKLKEGDQLEIIDIIYGG